MTPFGTTKRGEKVHALRLNAHGLTVSLLTYGAIVQDVRLDGHTGSLTVGADDLTSYEQDMPYHGAIVGPVANRLSGGRVFLDGIDHQLERNFLGKHTLHGGTRGLHARVWSVAHHSSDSATLTLDLPDGDCGLPGNRQITARFAVTEGPALTLDLTTTTDTETLINATNHSYWTLDGTGGMSGHTLQVHADAYLPTTDEVLPTGDVALVADTPFDFRIPRALDLGTHDYDHNWVLAQQRRPLTEVAILSTDALSLTVSTTEPGLHIYDDRPKHGAIVFETQMWPDAPAHRHFPSVALMPDSPITQSTRWAFARL